MAEKSSKSGCLWGILFLVIVTVGGYSILDEHGWLSHSDKIQVEFPAHDWQVGEYVDCYATKVDANAPIILACNGGSPMTEFREMDVKFWGQVTPSKDGIAFKCQRQQDSISCHLPSK